MNSGTTRRRAVGVGMIAAGVAATIADLLGFEFGDPAYFAALIAAGSGVLSRDDGHGLLCRVRERLRAIVGRSSEP